MPPNGVEHQRNRKRRTSIVWNDLFDTEGAAYEALETAVAQDGTHTFLDETDVVAPRDPALRPRITHPA